MNQCLRFALLSLLVLMARAYGAAAPTARVMNLPDGGIQPDVAVGTGGHVYIAYLHGDPKACDVMVLRSNDGGKTFGAPMRANSVPGSAIAMGTVRGVQASVGKNDRLHLAWMGSDAARPRGPGGATPMLYTRTNDDGAFEPERNIISEKTGLDGGGSVAADEQGNVFVAWHAPSAAGAGEQNRRVWLAKSSDEGKTFAAEFPVSDVKLGACGCCGMRIAATDGAVWGLYRTARQGIHRDINLLEFGPDGAMAQRELAPWQIGACVMSTAAMARSENHILSAWEAPSGIQWAAVNPKTQHMTEPTPAPKGAGVQKHPAIAANDKGHVMVAWTEGTGWQKGGDVVAKVYNEAGVPLSDFRADNLPAWDKPAVFATPDGSFTLVY